MSVAERQARVYDIVSGPIELQTEFSQGNYRTRGTITSAQLLALNATPQTLVNAPGAGKILVPEYIHLWLDHAGTDYDGVATGEDLAVKYTDGSGEEVARVETTGFLDASADAHRIVLPKAGVDAVADFTPVANAALVLHLLADEIATGNSPLKFEVGYKIVDLTW